VLAALPSYADSHACSYHCRSKKGDTDKSLGRGTDGEFRVGLATLLEDGRARGVRHRSDTAASGRLIKHGAARGSLCGVASSAPPQPGLRAALGVSSHAR